MDITEKIRNIAKEKNAVILAHNYQMPEVQDIADFVGDSLELSRTAAGTAADMIVFCGVHFMAETAKLLSPRKKVLLPTCAADARLRTWLLKKTFSGCGKRTRALRWCVT
jgi:quinolinate synthase